MANPFIDGKRLLNEREAAELLGFSVKTLQSRRWANQEPAFIRLSDRAIRYRLSDLMAWIERRRVEPRNTAEAAE